MSTPHHGEAAGSNEESQFQVVHKRSSGQGRRGVNSTAHPRSHHGRLPNLTSSTGREESAVSAAKKIQHLQQKEKSGDDFRLRPQTLRSDHYSSSSKSSNHSRSGSGSSTSSSKGPQMDHHPSGGEGTSNHGHSRHRNTSSGTDTETVNSSKGTGGNKKDRTTNRFEKLSKLGSDNDQSSSRRTRDSSPGVRSTRGLETNNDKKTHRSSAVSSLPKSKGCAHQHRKGQNSQSHGGDIPDQKPKKVQGETANRDNAKPNATSSKDIKRSYPHERKDSGIGSSPPSIDPQNEHESTGSSTGDLSNDGTDTTPTGALVDKEEAPSNQAESGTSESEVKVDDKRIKYSRELLLKLSRSPLSLKRHEALDEIDITLLKTVKEPLLQSAETPQVETEGKRKHPTALSLIKEHDLRQLPKVSLSPQRRSFHSGCSWKEMSNGSIEAPPETPPTSAKEANSFEFESPYPPTSRSNPSSFQLDPPPASHRHTPRVIDHVPIRDQELGRGEKRNWREKSRDNEWKSQPRHNYHHHPLEEEEPEWMEFGPNDRFELIELVGLDEHERERDARQEVSPLPPPEPTEDKEDDPALNEVDTTPTDKDNANGALEELVRENLAKEEVVSDEPSKDDDMLQAALDLDNEFVLDGFDFSTGLSICQELTVDEDDGTPSSEVQSPSEVSSVLRKVLKIGDGEENQLTEDAARQQADTRILGMSNRPVNALTLDEIQARENIQTTSDGEAISCKPNSEDLGAFNKLVAGLQSSVFQDSKQQSKPTQQLLNSVSKSDSPVLIPSTSTEAPPSTQSFGSILEKENNFDEEVITGAYPHFQHPREREVVHPYPTPTPMMSESKLRNISRLEHLERMLEKLDTSHMHLLRDREPRAMGYGGQMSGPSYADPRMKLSRDHMPPNLVSNYGTSRMPPQQMEQPRSLHVERELGYGYQDVITSDPRGDVMPGRVPHQHYVQQQHVGGSGRSSSNNWAIEMERRRVLELQQMERARVMERGGMYEGNQHLGGQPKMPITKPNISLLPTAVMRHMHNTKPSQSLSDMTKTSSLTANRMDQELTSKASMTHSSISNMLNEPPDHPHPRPPPTHMYPSQGGMGGQIRMVPTHHPMRPVGDPATASMMYRRYDSNNMPPRGGLQNPYMY